MDDRPGPRSQIGRARHFLQCFISEQRAATAELQANTRELERLLEGVVGTRADLRAVAAEEPAGEEADHPPDIAPPELRVAELTRQVESLLAESAEAIRESVRLRRRSERIRTRLGGGAAPPGAGGLSRREQQVLTLIVAGKSSKEIAAELGISFKTAVTHRASIMSKLDVHEIASVVREAIHRRLV